MAVSDINTVVIVGRLTRDAELKYMNNGNAVASISIATNRSRKDGEQWVSEANFFDVSYYGKPAEAVSRYLTKGQQIAVQGSLRQDRWEKDGQKFSKIRIQADSIELLGGRSGNAGGSSDNFGGYQQRSFSQPQSSGPVSGGYDPAENDTFGGDNSGFPDDIPF